MINRSFGRRGIALWHVLLTVATLGLIAAIVLPVFVSFTTDQSKPRGPSCQSQLKQIMLAVKQYTQDYDKKFPSAEGAGSAYGWADLLLPYGKTANLYQCPEEETPSSKDPTKTGYTDYWYNGQLEGKSEASFTESSAIFALGDGNDGKENTDARYHLNTLPEKWRIAGSPLYRHEDGSNVAFADGHVKWIRVKSWKNASSNNDGTFSLK
jgi:prepilin-type processing-associated H-X9-DG protein